MALTTYPHLMPRLGMSKAVSLLPASFACMACYGKYDLGVDGRILLKCVVWKQFV